MSPETAPTGKDESDKPDGVSLTGTGESEQPTPAEVIEKLPEGEIGGVLQTFFARMSTGNPIAARVTSEHVSDMISLRAEETRLEYEDRRHSRLILTGFVVFIILVLVGFAVFLAVRQKDALLTDLLTKVIIGLGGLGAGWGISHYRRRD